MRSADPRMLAMTFCHAERCGRLPGYLCWELEAEHVWCARVGEEGRSGPFPRPGRRSRPFAPAGSPRSGAAVQSRSCWIAASAIAVSWKLVRWPTW